MLDEVAALVKGFGRRPGGQSDASRRLVEPGEPAAAHLLGLLRDADDETRVLAAFALVEFAATPQRDIAVDGLLAALYDEHRPVRRRAALSLWHYRESRDAIRPTLTAVGTDPDHWLHVLRRGRCGGHWAEEVISSGHAELYFGYPLPDGGFPVPAGL